MKKHILKTKLVLLILTAALISAVCYSPESEGAEFSISPSITLRQEYDDNIFLTRDNREDDYITRVLPSVNMNYRAPLWDWTLDYTLNWWYYSEMGESDASHNLSLLSQVNVIKNLLYLDISDTYSNIVLEPRDPSTDINLDINRTDTNTFNLSPYIKYQINPATALTAGYRFADIWYEEEGGIVDGDVLESIDRQMHTGFTGIEHIFSPKFNGSLGIEYTADRPDRTFPDNDQTAAFFNVSYSIGPKTDFDGTAGYRWIDFAQGSDEDSPIYNISLTHRLHETGEIELSAISTFITLPLYGVIESRTEQITVRYGEAFSVNTSIFLRKDRYIEDESLEILGIEREEDDAIGVTIGIEYRPNPRLTFRVSGRYEEYEYMPEDETRDIYSTFGEVAYLLTNKATLILSYNYTDENGRLDTLDYTNNIAAVQLRITL